MAESSTILIAGCGYVGSHLGGLLADEGFHVWGLRRTAGELPPGITPVIADLNGLGELPAEIDYVVFCAATGGGPESAYQDVFVDGLSALLERMPSVRRFVFVSSTGVYAQRAGEWVDEQSAAEPALVSGKYVLRAEQILRSAPMQTVAVRFAGIYGPGRIRLIRSLRGDKPAQVSHEPRYLNQIHRDDCCGVLRHLLTVPDPQPVYIACDSEPATRYDVLTWLAQRTGLPPPEVAGAGDYPGSARGNKRCSNRRLLESGYRFRYPTYREGYQAILAEQ